MDIIKGRTSLLNWWRFVLPACIFLVIIIAPTPEGLSSQGHHALATIILALGLWCTEALPIGITSVIAIIVLVITGGAGPWDSMHGFRSPVVLFLIGVLTLGLALSQSGLADRLAHRFVVRSRSLYWQSILSFPITTFLIPSAIARGAILIPVYRTAFEVLGVSRRAPLARSIMMALASVNRLASTALLTGGVTPVVAAGLISGIQESEFSWGWWFILMAAPYYVLIAIASLIIYMAYRPRNPSIDLSSHINIQDREFSSREKLAAIILLTVSTLWLTDFIHHWHPSIPAIFAMLVIILPRIGILNFWFWIRRLSWSNYLVMGSALSLANALIHSGAADWIANQALTFIPVNGDSQIMNLLGLMLASSLLRLVIPNITGFLALAIPIGVSVGDGLGLNPLICGLVVTIVGDGVLYYPAQSPSATIPYLEGHLSASEILAFGVVMTGVCYAIVITLAIPYWSLLGQSL